MISPASTTYSYRPSALGAHWTFRLEGQALFWDAGRKSGRIPLRDIRRMRLSFKPTGTQSTRFRLEIWSEGAPKVELVSTSSKGIVEYERHDSAYRAFVVELHRQLSLVNDRVSFERGVNTTVYWLGFVVFVTTSLVAAILIVRALEAQAWQAAGIVGAIAAVFFWQAGRYFRRNKPGRYHPDALPSEVLPQP
ncbi:MAG TPA: hypothetical protein VFS63_13575 [Pseudolabrys sp.]|jgi:hypothetical protein|nr:hypothetical protein [Pseudolabrys sp.]